MTTPTVAKKEKKNKVGRPRSAKVHRAILAATYQVVAEEGIEGASIEAIAERAGVGKTTIYRRWDTKEALIADAMSALHLHVELPDTGNLRADLIALLKEFVCEAEAQPERISLFLRLLSEAKAYPELLKIFHERVYAQRLRFGAQLVQKAYERGELRENYDILFLGGLFAGPLLYLMLTSELQPDGCQMSELPERIVDAVLNGVGVQ